MRRPCAAFLAAAALAVAAAAVPAPLVSQPVEPRVPVERAEFGGRAHIQFNTTSASDEAPTSEFLVRRARIWGAARINDWIDGAVLVDMAGATASARYAFVRFSLDPAFRLSVGQFKRAFDLFELTSSSDMLLVERDGVIRGITPCAGVGGPCTYSRFSERLQHSSLDVGALVQGEVARGRLEYLLTVSNGSGPNARETNHTKSFAGRLAWTALEGVVVGLNGGLHDFTNEVTGLDEHAPAVALDLEVGSFLEGFHVQAGVLGGDNWLNLDEAGGSSPFLTAQGVVSYRVPTAPTAAVEGVEPMGRVSWGDPDRNAGADGGLLFTPGFVVHLQGKNKVAANVDVWRPQSGATAWSFKATALLYF